MRKLIEVKGAIQQGVSPDTPFDEQSVWLNSENIIFAEKGIRPSAPQVQFSPKLDDKTITGMFEFGSSNLNVIYRGSVSSATIVTISPITTTISDITNPGGYTLKREDLWNFVKFGDTVLAANGAAPQQISSVAPFADIDLTGAFFLTAKIVGSLRGHALFAHTDVASGGSDQTFHWSDSQQPLVWDPALDNTAGSLYIREFGGPIISWTKFAGGYIVFGHNIAFLIQYVGAPEIFQAPFLIKGIGAVSPHSITSIGSIIYGVSSNGFWQSNGVTYDYFDRPTFHREIFDQINKDKLNLTHVWHNPEEEMIVIFWVSEDSEEIDRATGYFYKLKKLAHLAYARTATAVRNSLNYGILGDAEGNIYRQLFVQPGDPFTFGSTGGEIPLRLDAEAVIQSPAYDRGIAYGEMGYSGHSVVTG